MRRRKNLSKPKARVKNPTDKSWELAALSLIKLRRRFKTAVEIISGILNRRERRNFLSNYRKVAEESRRFRSCLCRSSPPSDTCNPARHFADLELARFAKPVQLV